MYIFTSVQRKREILKNPLCPHIPSLSVKQLQHHSWALFALLQLTVQNILYCFPVTLLVYDNECCICLQHLQRLSPQE
jgi:hypothetical protein